jgi:hypothetical protein
MVECLWQQEAGGNRERLLPGGSDRQIAGRVLHVVNGEHYAGAERVQDLLGGALPWFGCSNARCVGALICDLCGLLSNWFASTATICCTHIHRDP